MFTVYVLRSDSTGKIYIGQTSDLVNRLERHNKGLVFKKNSYTALNVGPWKLVYSEECTTRTEALKREKELKSHKGRDYIKNVVVVAQR